MTILRPQQHQQYAFLLFWWWLALRCLPGSSLALAGRSRPAVTPSFVRPDMTDLTEAAAIETASRMTSVLVPVPASIHPDGTVGISYVHWAPPATAKAARSRRSQPAPPLILIHGFDSSCLEYRRLGPRLAAAGVDTYAVDLLGWGYTQLHGVTDFGAMAKIAALQSWIATVLGNNASFCIAGASLGGAAAIEVAADNANCAGLILLDAQGFVDGIGPMAALPTFAANVGVALLKSIPLRSSANQMTYYDKKTYATDEAMRIGRLHCLRNGWDVALVNFMQSGGFAPSARLAAIHVPALVLWGRQDTILDGTIYAPRFVETLPNARLQWIEDCGHVPHLEQPDATCDAMAAFMLHGMGDRNNVVAGQSSPWIGLGAAGLTALGAYAADLFPAWHQ